MTSIRRPWPQMLAASTALALSLGALGACGAADERAGSPAAGGAAVSTLPGPYDYDFTIPAGTGERIDAGERPEVFPDTLDVRVGETIRIVNDDDRGHTMGTFFVLANSTLTYRFSTPGVFEGECTVNPEDGFVLTIRP